FRHITAIPTKSPPDLWTGHSDTAACALALTQGSVSDHSPIVLISCNCRFWPKQRFYGATLLSVSISRFEQENYQALLQKWMSAINKDVHVMALVLFHEDIDRLLE